MGAYYMKWLGYSWELTNKLNTQFAERPMSTRHHTLSGDDHLVLRPSPVSVRRVSGNAVVLPVPELLGTQVAQLPEQPALHQIATSPRMAPPWRVCPSCSCSLVFCSANHLRLAGSTRIQGLPPLFAHEVLPPEGTLESVGKCCVKS